MATGKLQQYQHYKAITKRDLLLDIIKIYEIEKI